MPSERPPGTPTARTIGTQHLTALAAPEALVDWRLAIYFETAISSGILEELPATVEQIAARRGLDAGAARALLHVLAAWGHVRIDQRGVYSEGPRALAGEEQSALAQHGTWIRRWASLVPRRLADRRATSDEDPHRPDLATGLALLESPGRPYVQPVVDACLAIVGDGTAGKPDVRVLDLGGGHGAYSVEFASRGAATTMQDLPAVVELARADGRLEASGVELVAGDALAHLPPGPFDLVLCGTLTNLFDIDDVHALLEGLHKILTPGGHVAIATWLRDQGPVGAAFGVQMLVATPEGDAHSGADYHAALKATGYTDIQIAEVADPPLALITARRLT